MAQQADNYWVVETNKFSKGQSIVRIYDRSSHLLHEETVGRSIDISRKRDKRYLNRKVVAITKESDSTIARSNKRQRRG